jgi:putative hemolysin
MEIAYVSLKKIKIINEADKGNKTANVILHFLNDPGEYLSSIQVGITLISLVEGYYGGRVLSTLLEPLFMKWGISKWIAHILGLLVSIGGITYLSIVLGELLPKTLALRSPQKIAFLLTPSFRIFTLIAFPFIKILTTGTHFLIRLFGGEKTENQILTDNDLKGLLGLAYKQGTLEKEELKIHENIFGFYDLLVEKIMVEKDKVVTVKETNSRESIESVLKKSEHNYFPLLNGDDQVIGILSSKDFFMNPEKSVTELLQPPCFIKVNQTAPDVLNIFKEQRRNFGAVTSDTGNFIGIVTMNDLGRSLIGNLP